MTSSTLAVILAGGGGRQLPPLMGYHARSTIPFAATCRVIDFALSNCRNSGLRDSYVLTGSTVVSSDRPLDRQSQFVWRHGFSSSTRTWAREPQQASQLGLLDDKRYGNAAAVYHNLSSIATLEFDLILVLAGDQIYTMDYRPLIDFHLSQGADVTAAAFAVSPSRVSHFDIFEVDEDSRITSLQERPEAFPPLDPTLPPLASIGVYLFNREVLRSLLLDDAEKSACRNDFVRDLLPAMVWNERLYAYRIPGNSSAFYWRELATIDDYWAASMDLLTATPALELENPAWPIQAVAPIGAPSVLQAGSQQPAYRGVERSRLAARCLVDGACVQRSVLSDGVRVGAHSRIVQSVLLEGTEVGQHCRLQRVVTDRGVTIPSGTELGFDQQQDRRWFHLTPQGIVVVTAGAMDRYRHRRRTAPGATSRGKLAYQSLATTPVLH